MPEYGAMVPPEPKYKERKHRTKDSISTEDDERIHQNVKLLLDEMDDALTKDRAAN